MIQRHVYLRLTEPHQTAAGRAEVAARSQRLAELPQVRSVTVGLPADPHARAAWDLVLVLTFDGLQEVTDYIADPDHRAYVDDFLKPRLAVIKAWNFEV